MLDMITLVVIVAGVLQLPFLMDFIHHMWPHSPIGRAVTNAARQLLRALIAIAVTLTVYLNISLLLRKHVEGFETRAEDNVKGDDVTAADDAWPWWLRAQSLVHIGFTLWLYVILLDHYRLACFTHPSLLPPTRKDGKGMSGAVHVRPIYVQAMALSNEADGPQASSGSESESERDRFCSICNRSKSFRTHHCRICNVCVELMDHHCPFTGNCASLSNFRSFYLSLLYGFIGLSYAVYMSWFGFHTCFWGSSNLKLAWYTNSSEECARMLADWRSIYGPRCMDLGKGAFLFVPAFFGWLPTTVILLFHSWAIMQDETTVDIFIRWMAKLERGIKGGRSDDNNYDEARAEGKRKDMYMRRKDVGASIKEGEKSQHIELAEYEFIDLSAMECGDGNALSTSSSSPSAHFLSSVGPSPSPSLSSLSPLSYASPFSSSSSSPPTLYYNPHKSFSSLVIQDLPWWTLIIPPFILHRINARVRTQTNVKQAATLNSKQY